MRKRAEAVLCSGHNVILDATFLHLEHRRQAMQLAADCGASFVIVQAIAPDDELRRRIGERDRAAADASEANLAVLDHQLQIIEALTEAERKFAIPMDSRDVDAASTLPKQVRRVARAWSG
jgi:hypothetical protein